MRYDGVGRGVSDIAAPATALDPDNAPTDARMTDAPPDTNPDPESDPTA